MVSVVKVTPPTCGEVVSSEVLSQEGWGFCLSHPHLYLVPQL